jgi:hypothetical protein
MARRQKRCSKARRTNATTLRTVVYAGSGAALAAEIDSLETRLLLAGTTTVSLEGDGRLLIQDTDGGLTDDRLVIVTDTGSGVFRISDDTNLIDTSIAGATGSGTHSVEVPFGSIPGIIIDTRSGDDTVSIGGLDTGSSLSVEVDANSSLFFWDTDSVTVNGSLNLRGGALSIEAETITFSTGAVVSTSQTSGDSGDIKLSGRSVSLGNGARLLAQADSPHAPGAVTISVDAWTIVRTTSDPAPEAAIELSGAEIRGGLVTLEANASERIGAFGFKKNATARIEINNSTIDGLSVVVDAFADTTLAPPIDIEMSNPESTILQFSDNGMSPATITRSAGNWLTDGFVPGQSITIVDSQGNDGAYQIQSISLDGTTITFDDATVLADETTNPPLYVVRVTGSSVLPPTEEIVDARFGFAGAAIVSLAETSAQALVLGNSSITASAGSVDITAFADGRATPLGPNLGIPAVLSVAAVWADSTAEALATVEGTSHITASNQVNLNAETSNYVTATSIASARNNPINLTFAGATTTSIARAFTAPGTTVQGGEISVTATSDIDIAVAGAVANAGSSGASMAVATNFVDVETDAHVGGMVTTTSGDLTVTATATTTDNITESDASNLGNTGALTTQIENQFNQFFRDKGKSTLMSAGVGGSLGEEANWLIAQAFPVLTSGNLNLGGAVTIVDTSRNVDAYIADSSVVTVAGDIEVTAFVSDFLNITASAASDSDGVAIGGAVAIGSYQNEVNAFIGSNAIVTATGSISLDAQYVLPFPWDTSLNTLAELLAFDFDSVEETLSFLGNAFFEDTLSPGSRFFQSFVANNSPGNEFGLSGSVEVLSFANHATAEIRDGAHVTSKEGSVDVFARTELNSLGAVGSTISFSFLEKLLRSNALLPRIDQIAADAKLGDKFKITPFSQPGSGIGGSVTIYNLDDAATARIGDQAVVNANHGVSVAADTAERIITVTQAGGTTQNLGVFGATSIINGSTSSVAFVEDTASINADSDPSGMADSVPSDDLIIRATSDPRIYNFTGGVTLDANVGVGASVGLTNIETVTKAFVGNETELAQSPEITFQNVALSNSPTLDLRNIETTGELEFRKAELTDDLAFAGIAITDDMTFTAVANGPDTITLATGDWAAAGFAPGHLITIADSASNNGTYQIADVSGTLVTLVDADELNDEQAVAATSTAHGATITRSSGLDWTADDFLVGQTVTIDGTASNDGSYEIVAVDGGTVSVKYSGDDAVTLGTFNDAVATGSDSIRRVDGLNWADDGFTAGQIITIDGSTSNDGVLQVAAVDGDLLLLVAGGQLTEETDLAVTVTSNDTITRDSGSWLDDGFLPGMTITIAGSPSNNGQFEVDAVTDSVLTLRKNPVVDDLATMPDETSPDATLVTETGVTGVSINGPDTITRDNGSWFADGFRPGDTFTVSGSTNNNGTFTVAETDGTVLVLVAANSLVDEVATGVSIGDQAGSSTGSIQAEDVIIEALNGEQITSFSLAGALSSGNSNSTGSASIASAGTNAGIGGGTAPDGASGSFGIGVSGDVSINQIETTTRAYVDAAVTITTGQADIFAASEGTPFVTGSPVLVFADDAAGDTITRSSGSWTGDGFRAGNTIHIVGTPGGINDGYFRIATLTDSVVTLEAADSLTNQSTRAATVKAGPAMSGTPELTFSSQTLAADTIERDTGSWIVDGFRPGQIIEISGTALNNGMFKVSGVSAKTLSISLVTLSDFVTVSHVLADETSTTARILSSDDGLPAQILAGSGSVVLQGNANSVGLAGSYAQNTIDGVIEAYVSGTTLTLAGDLNVLARTPGAIESYAASGTLAGKVGIAGQVTNNEISRDTRAFVENSNVTAHDITVSARDVSSIFGVAGAATLGGKVGLGASIALNTIDNSVLAWLDASDAVASGDLIVEAVSEADIRVITAAIAAGTKGMQAAASISINTIANHTDAWLNGQMSSAGVSANNVSITSLDGSSITADGGGLGIAIATLTETGVTPAATLGVSAAVNEVSNTSRAWIDSTTVSALGDLAVTATVQGVRNNKIAFDDSVVDIASDTITLPNHGFSTGDQIVYRNLGLPGDAVEGLLADHRYFVIMVDDDTVKLAATYADATAASPVAINLISAPIGTTHSLEVETATINALAFGGALSVASGSSTTLGFAGSGAGSRNDVANTIEAAIRNSSSSIHAGSVSVAATDLASIHSDTIGASLSVATSSSASAASLAVGVSISLNEIDNSVLAVIENSSVTTTTGDISVAVHEDAAIDATAVAASVSLSGATSGVSLSVSGGGASARNVITTDANALLRDSIITSAADVSIDAVSRSSILATIIAASASIGLGGNAGAAASIGVAQAENFIGFDGDGSVNPAGVVASSENTNITALTGDLTFTALADQSVGATVIAGSVAFATGKKAGISASGAGATATNQIGMNVKAVIADDGTGGIEASSITLAAVDASTITSVTAALSLAGSVGGTAAGSISVGVSLAHNEISNVVEASVSNADTKFRTTGPDAITLDARENASISAVSAAAVASGAVAGTAGIALSGAGAEATNVILTSTRAFIQDSQIVTPGSVSVRAEGNADISAIVATSSMAAGGGGTVGAGVSIGVSVARNLFGLSASPSLIQAFAERSSIDAAGALTFEALANNSVDASVVAGSAAISGSSVGAVGLSGAGVSAENVINVHTQSFIDNAMISGGSTPGAWDIIADTFSLTARDTSTINALAGAATLAASFAGVGSVAISVGTSLGTNEISSQTEAYITAARNVTTTGGDVTLNAIDQSTISSTSDAVSIAATGIGVALSGTGADATNTILTKTNAHIDNSSIHSALDVTVSASDFATIETLVGGVAATGLGFADAVATALNDIGSVTEAYIDNATINDGVAGGGAVAVTVNGGSIIDSAAASVGAGVVGVVAATVATNDIHTTRSASLRNGTTVGASSVTVSASESSDIEVYAVSVALAGGNAGGTASALNDIGNTVSATIEDAWVTSTGGVDVSSSSASTINAYVPGLAISAQFGLGLVWAENDLGTVVRSAISNSTVIASGGDLNVEARSSDDVFTTTVVLAGSPSLAAAGGYSQLTYGGTTEAWVSSSTLDVGTNNVLISADGTIVGTPYATGGGVGSGAAAFMAAELFVEGVTRAFIEGTVSVTAASLSLTATDDITTDPFTLVAAVGGLTGAGAYSTVDVTRTTEAYVADAAVLDASTATVAITSTSVVSATGTTIGVSGGTLVGVTALIVDVDVHGTTRAFAGDGVTLTAATLELRADASNDVDAPTTAVGIGAVGLAGVLLSASDTTTVDAYVGPQTGMLHDAQLTDATTIETSGAVSVLATIDSTVLAEVTAVSLGAIVSGAGTLTTATASPVVRAFLGDDAVVISGDSVEFRADAQAAGIADGLGLSGSGGIAVAVAIVDAHVNPVVGAFTESGGSIDAAQVSFVSRLNVDGNGMPINANHDGSIVGPAYAEVLLGTGGLLAGGNGAELNITNAPVVRTAVGSGTTITTSGDVTVSGNAHLLAESDALSISLGLGVGTGVVIPTVTAAGSITTEISGSIESAGNVSVTSTVDAATTVEGRAGGGGIGGSATASIIEATTAPIVVTQIAAGGVVTAGADVSVSSDVTSSATATAGAMAFAFGVSIGIVDVTATDSPDINAVISGAVTSLNGEITVEAGHNFDRTTGLFLTGLGASASSRMLTVSIVASIGMTSVTANATATTVASVESTADIQASGPVIVDAHSSNESAAQLKNDGGALVAVASGDPTANSSGTTLAQVAGDITDGSDGPGASAIIVTAQGANSASAGARTSNGGFVSVGASDVRANAVPVITAEVSGVLRASGAITIHATSETDADAAQKSSSGGFVDVPLLDAQASASPLVAAIVGDNSTLAADSIDIVASHGQAPDLSDGTFDAVTGVSPADDQIAFSKPHGLLTGDTVTYDQNGQVLGVDGLTDGREYTVLAVDESTLQLGATFNSLASDGMTPFVDVATNTISFPSAHHLQTGDLVSYDVTNGSSVVGGLVAGMQYVVSKVDDTTIRLLDPTVIPAEVDITAADISGNVFLSSGHGFLDGQAVTYRAATPVRFGVPGVDDNAETIDAGLGHGFAANDQVIYQTDGTPVSGLISGGRYYVTVDSLSPNLVQLSATPGGAAIDLTVPSDPAAVEDIHTLRRVGDQAFGNLADGGTYYIDLIDSESFRLMNSVGTTINPVTTDPVTGATLTGTSTIGVEGVDLTSVGSGSHTLTIDITSVGTGIQLLHGAGKARALAGAPSGDGIVTSSASGSGGGFVTVADAQTQASSAPAVEVSIGPGSTLTATNIALDSLVAAHASASAARSGGGFVAVGDAEAVIVVNSTSDVTVGAKASLLATNAITINSNVDQESNVLASSKGGGFASSADADVAAVIDYRSAITIDSGAMVIAGNNVVFDATSQIDVDADARTDSSGFGAGASTDSVVTLGTIDAPAATRTTIGSGALIQADSIDLKARTTELKAYVEARATAGGAVADADADAIVVIYDATEVVLLEDSLVHGAMVSMTASHAGVALAAHSDADTDGLFADADSQSKVDYISENRVVTADSSTVIVSDLTVTSTQDIDHYNRRATADVDVFGSESTPERGSLTAHRQVIWDGDIRFGNGSVPELVIDANGQIVTARDVTVNGGQSTGVVSGPIVVDPIANTGGGGTATMTTSSLAVFDGVTPPVGEISGMNGVFDSGAVLPEVSIQNQSNFDLILSDVLLSDASAEADVLLISESVVLEFDVAGPGSGFNPIVDVVNSGTGDVTVAGLVDNPIGTTHVENTGGSIFGSAGAADALRGHSVELVSAGVIGTSQNRLAVELVRYGSFVTGFNASAIGDINLDVTGRLRDTDTGLATFNVGTLESTGGDVDILFQSSVQETTSIAGGTPGIFVTVNSDPGASYFEHFRPDTITFSQLDPRIFADTSLATTIDSVFDLAQVTGHDITLAAAFPTVSDPVIDLIANTNHADAGQIDVQTHGDITLNETVGDFNLHHVETSAGDITITGNGNLNAEFAKTASGNVVATIAGNVVDAAPNDGIAALTGDGITVHAGGAIGTATEYLQIDSSFSVDGNVFIKTTSPSGDSVFLTETTGTLHLDGVVSETGNVAIQVLNGSLLDGIDGVGDDEADLQGHDIDIEVTGGSIGESANDVEIFGAGTGFADDSKAICPGFTGDGRLYATASGDVYLATVDGSLNVLAVSSSAGDVRIDVVDSGALNSTADFIFLPSGGVTQRGQSIATSFVAAGPAGGSVEIHAAGNVTASGTTSITAGQSILITSGQNIDLNGGVVAATSGPITMLAGDAISVDADLTSQGTTLKAQNGVTLGGMVNAGAGTVLIEANRDGIGSDGFTMLTDSSITTTNDTVSAVVILVNSLMGGTGNAALAAVSAGTTSGSTGGRVTVSTNMGAITDGNGAANNLTAGNAILLGMAGVGASGDPVETTLSRIEGVGGSGGFFVENTQNLIVGGIAMNQIGVRTSSGDIVICAQGSLTAAENVTATGSGSVTLKTVDAVAGFQFLTVNGGVTVNSGSGNVAILSGDDITLSSGSHVIATGGTISIESDFDDADAGTGTSITIAAELDSTDTTVTSGFDDDTVTITYPDGATNSGTVTLSDSGGIDAVIINGTAGDDAFFLTTEDPPTTATTEQVTRGDATTEPIVIPADFESLRLNGHNGLDTFDVQPSMLFPVTLDGGSPTFGDPDVPPGDTLDLDPFGNSFFLTGNTLYVSGGAPDAYEGITLINIENVPLDPISNTTLRFDLNKQFVFGNQSPTEPGWTGVGHKTLYSDGLGYGWQEPIYGGKDSTGNFAGLNSALVGDWHTLVPSSLADTETFTADLSSPGFVLVTVSYGNDGNGLEPFQIENGDSGDILATNLTTQGSEIGHVSFLVNILDMTLDLDFRTLSTSYRTITIKSIDIAPGNVCSMGFAPPAAPLGADGTTIDSFLLDSAPPNTLITVETDLGTLINSDADALIDGLQVLTDGNGQATILLQRPTGAGQATVTFNSVTGQEIGCSVVEYGLTETRLFDFDFQNNNPDTQSGYTSVLHTDMYTSGRGHGWLGPVTSLGISATGPLSSLLTDAHRSSEPATFRVDLPNGTYNVHAWFYDGGDHLGLQLSVNGEIALPAFNLEGNELVEASFEVAISNGHLDLLIEQVGDRVIDPYWTISGLEIRPASAIGSVTPVNIGAVPADGSTSTTVSASVTVPDGTLFTVSSSLGTITSTDASPLQAGIQVVATGGTVEFAITSPGHAGVPTVEWRSDDGGVQTILTDVSFLEFVGASVRQLDFNVRTGSGESTTEPGFVGVLNTAMITSGLGYGWTSLVRPYLRSEQAPQEDIPGVSNDELYRDGATASGPTAHTFQFTDDGAFAYDVRLYLSSDGFIDVTVEGAGTQTAPSGWYQSLDFAGALDTNGDGYVSVTLVETNGRSAGWITHGIEIIEVPPLYATVAGSGATAIDADDIAPLLKIVTTAFEQHIDLTAQQQAVLATVVITISDLDGSLLGYVNESPQDGQLQIVLDDNGAGLGWSTSLESVTDGHYDLLTALAHELGHAIGYDHDDANSDDDILKETLTTGLRRNTFDGIDNFFTDALNAAAALH